MSVDTVFNGEMRPVFVDDPATVMRRLKAGHPESWEKVCIGSSGLVVTIPEYLYSDTYKTVQQLIRGVMKKQTFTLYKKDPARLDLEIERTARRIIELIQKENGRG